MTQKKHPSFEGCFSYAIEKAVGKIEIFKLFGSIFVNNDAANQAIDDTDKKAQETAKTFGEMVTSAAKVGAGIAMAMGAAVLAVGGLALKLNDDLKKALNGVQAATGYSDEAMIGMKDTLLEIYNNNFGENFEDIGKAIAEVGKQTGATGDNLKELTQDALMLRDTFEFEVNESTRSAKMLMDKFGLSGEEAFNLIAQGAQSGLDKNGDLLDTINEYSVHFEQLGFDAEDMFNMLKNGAASGTFSVDKLGDAIKEFGIRSKDGSKASQEAFQGLGLDANTMTKDFAAGGDAAQAAFDKVAQALFSLKDPVAQNAAGVALFGTQWEDLGVKGVQALAQTQGAIRKNVDALGKINEVKYDSLGQAMEGLRRNMETSILIPLGEKVMPLVSTFVNWVIVNMPLIKNEIEFAFTVIGAAIAMVSGFISGLASSFSQNTEGIKSSVILAFDAIIQFWDAWGTTIIAVFTVVFEKLRTVFMIAWDLISVLVESSMGIISGIIKTILALITGDWAGAWEGIKLILSSAWEAIKAIVSAAINIIKVEIDTVLSLIRLAWEAVWNGLSNFVSNNMEYVRATIVQKWNEAMQFLQSIDLLEIGKNIIQGLITGITDRFSGVKAKVEELAGMVPEWAKQVLGIHSPSTVLQEVGQYTIDGLILGIGNKASAVGTAMDNIAATVTSKASAFVTAGTTIGQQFSKALQGSIKEPTFGSGGGGGGSGGSGGGGSGIKRVDGIGNVVTSSTGEVTVNTKSGSYNESTNQYSITNFKTGKTLYRNGSKEEYEKNFKEFHEGGWVGLDLRPDEVPIIAQRGEFVLSRKMIEGLAKGSTSAGNTDNSKVINQTVNIYSPAAVSPAETARQSKRALQELALAF